MRVPIQLVLLLLALPPGDAQARSALQQPLAAADAAGSTRVLGRGLLAGLPQRALAFDERPDELWAVADAYKAGFDRDGAVFVPFFGSSAPRDFPLRLRVEHVRWGAEEVAFARDVEPLREGACVRYARGAFLERYDLGLESMEQSFLVPERLGAGSLLIELALESELRPRADGADVVLECERGHVRYSGAVAIDAGGARVAAPTRLVDGRIRIEVPEQELARLRFPLVVDPVLSTFSLDPAWIEGATPDVAWDEAFGHYCMVAERTFSASDHDVVLLMLEADGSPAWNLTLDASTTDWSAPRVASNRTSSRFLVVAATGAVGARQVRGRTVRSDFPGFGLPIAISPAGTDATAPDVGGDDGLLATSAFCVVWQRVNTASDADVLFRMVRPDGLLSVGGTLAGPANTIESAPRISKSCGDAAQRCWSVVWQRTTLSQSDLYGARIRFDGSLADAAFPIDTSLTNTRFPVVSSPTHDADGRVVVAYMRGSVGNTDTWLYVLRGATIEQHASLNVLTGASSLPNHLDPSIDGDGRDFLVVETQSFPSTTLYGLFASNLTWLGGRLRASEGDVSLGASGNSAPISQVACRPFGGDASRQAWIAWHFDGFAPDPRLFGSLFDMSSFTSVCEPGTDGVPSCPCGNAASGPGRGCENSASTGGARLAAAGSVFPDTLVLSASGTNPSAACLLLQANAWQDPAPFGDGLSCVGGTLLRMGARTASGGQASWPAPNAPSLSSRSALLGDTILRGSVRLYFAYYRDPAAAWACAGTFNSTQTLQVRW